MEAKMGARSKRAVAGEVWTLMARFTLEKFQRGEHLSILRDHGLTPGHLKTLGILDPDEPRPMGVIAEIMHCDASQMTLLVDRLEERGLVERRSMPKDRRVKTIALTPEGIEFRRKVLLEVYRPPEELLALDVATLETLREQLAKLPPPSGPFFKPVKPEPAAPGTPTASGTPADSVV
jgi:MarR family transcriptional regulator, organic hydroperoxide resistance regulator